MKLALKVVPGAKTNSVQWLDEDAGILKVRVNTAPEKGKANKAVEALLAQSLGLPKSAVSIISGHTSAQKVVEITGLSENALRRQLQAP